MAKLKVGDIEIDGGEVRLGRSVAQIGASHSFATPSVAFLRSHNAGPAPLPQADYAFLKTIPFAPGFVVIAGCIIGAAGIIGTFVGGRLDSVADLLLHGTFLIPFGAGLAVMGVLKAIHQDSADRVDATNADGVTEEYITELGELLRHEDKSHTVEWVQNRLGWNQGDVVRTLAWLRERGELREEVDIDTGHYYYVATPHPRDLDARLRATNSKT